MSFRSSGLGGIDIGLIGFEPDQLENYPGGYGIERSDGSG